MFLKLEYFIIIIIILTSENITPTWWIGAPFSSEETILSIMLGNDDGLLMGPVSSFHYGSARMWVPGVWVDAWFVVKEFPQTKQGFAVLPLYFEIIEIYPQCFCFLHSFYYLAYMNMHIWLDCKKEITFVSTAFIFAYTILIIIFFQFL